MNIYTVLEKNSDFLRIDTETNNEVQKVILNSSETILRNLKNDKFLQLNKEENFVWESLGRGIGVNDVIFSFFQKYNKYAKSFICGVIFEFYRSGFLKRNYKNIYISISKQLEKKSLLSKVKNFGNIFFKFKIEINNLDKALTVLYDRFFYIFFQKPVLFFYGLISVLGSVLLVKTFLSYGYNLWHVKNSATLGALIAIFINLSFTTLHEAAHAFTTKYYGQKVKRGGFMFYLGFPCFFVDTNEIWLSGRRSRIMVSLAGPLSTILVSSVLSIIIYLFPELSANEILFKCIFWGWLSALINLNPLLELDGYYILIDYFKKPMLRTKSFNYIKLLFRDALTEKNNHKLQWDKIVYGFFATGWTVFSVIILLVIMEAKSQRIVSDFLNNNSLILKIIGGGLIMFWILPVIISVFIFLFIKIREITLILFKNIFLKNEILLFIFITFLVFSLSFLKIPRTISLIFFICATIFFVNRLRYISFSVFFWMGLFLGAVSIINHVNLCYLGLYGVNFLSFAFFSIFALAILKSIKNKFLLGTTVFTGAGIVLVAYLNEIYYSALLVSYIIVLERKLLGLSTVNIKNHRGTSGGGDIVKLINLTPYCVNIFTEKITSIFKKNKAQSIIAEIEKTHILDKDGFKDHEKSDHDLVIISKNAKMIFNLLIHEYKKAVGDHYAYKLFLNIFDSLSWNEKEIFDKYLFQEAEFKDIKCLKKASFDKYKFLKSVVIFSSFERWELAEIIDNLKIENVKKGKYIIKEGEVGEKFYIILEGEVEVSINKNQYVTSLYERDFFGEISLIKKCLRTANIIAVKDTILITLDSKTFTSFFNKHPDTFSKIDHSVRVLNFLKGIPFFRSLNDKMLWKFAAATYKKFTFDKEDIVLEGDERVDYYIIKKGRFVVEKNLDNGEKKEIAVLGRGEFFGETVWLVKNDIKKTSAGVRSLGDGLLYGIKGYDFKRILDENDIVLAEFERISSRRMLENKYG